MSSLWNSLRKKARAVKWFGPIPMATAFAGVIILLLWVFSGWYGGAPGEIVRGIYIEAGGAVMDIVIFGVILALLVDMTSRHRDVTRQLELIDDYKKWDSAEARYRIAGAIRRLNKLNRTAINFSGIEISDFRFRWLEIESIAGSTFYDGSWGTWSGKDRATLRDVDFSGVDCRNVMFPKSNPFPGLKAPGRLATFTDCSFQEAQLQGAVFRGACLEWSENPPEEMGTWEDMEDGNAVFLQTYSSPFHGADLKGASFEGVLFRNADFRGAENVEECSFTGAKGLDECLFDSKEVKEEILRKASSSPERT